VGGCVEVADMPFAPLVGALRTLARTAEPAELDALLGPASPSTCRAARDSWPA
jgi:hypothetical protein